MWGTVNAESVLLEIYSSDFLLLQELRRWLTRALIRFEMGTEAVEHLYGHVHGSDLPEAEAFLPEAT